jgi:murein DD-endopeptidase MepM/ murein hydrolase activator NlpD
VAEVADCGGLPRRFRGGIATVALLAPLGVPCYVALVSSPPGAGGSKYAGRVVDPDVRDDGDKEPDDELNSSPAGAAAAEPVLAPSALAPPETAPSEPEPAASEASAAGGEPEPTAPEAGSVASEAEASGSESPSRGAEVRERLLAKARALELSRGASPAGLDSELDAIGRPARPADAGANEDFVPPAAGRAPAAPIAPGGARELSPSWVAVFSALIGMATIASITALFMSLSSRLPSAASPQPSAAAAAPSAKQSDSGPQEPKPKAKRQRQKVPGPWRVADEKGNARYRYITGKIGTESFLKALAAAGAPEAQGYRVLAAMRGVVDLDKCKKTDRFEALLDRGTSKLFALEYMAGAEEVYQAKEVDGRLTGSRLDLKLERGQVLGALSYDGSSFEKSAELGGFDPGLSKVVARALDGHMALDELDRGDVLRVVVQEVTVLGDFSRYAGVEALELTRVDPKKSKLRIYYSDAPGVRGYYDHDGRAPFEGGWRKPIKDAPRTSPFNPKRMHPVLKRTMPHNGTDYGAPTGTPVGAASFGTVSFIGNGGPAGNLVKVMHPGGVETGYAHLSRFAEGLKVGDKVKRMQLVGYVGNTGRSTGPHLHFSASRDGKFFDAETLNLDGMRKLTPAEREAFKPLLAKYDPMLDSIPMPERFEPLAPPEPPTVAAAPPTPSAESHDAMGDAEDDASQGVPPAGAAPAAAMQKAGGSSVYLSDKELLEAQSATDDGEVEQ